MQVRKKALALSRKYQSNDPFEIVKNLNVIVVSYKLNGVRGFYQFFQRNNIIYIDESLSDSEKKFVLAHELGHMLLHKKANAIFMDTRTHFNTDKYEIEADRFAMNLLLPDDVIAENLECTTSQLSRLFGYKKGLIELRMKDFER